MGGAAVLLSNRYAMIADPPYVGMYFKSLDFVDGNELTKRPERPVVTLGT